MYSTFFFLRFPSIRSYFLLISRLRLSANHVLFLSAMYYAIHNPFIQKAKSSDSKETPTLLIFARRLAACADRIIKLLSATELFAYIQSIVKKYKRQKLFVLVVFKFVHLFFLLRIKSTDQFRFFSPLPKSHRAEREQRALIYHSK